mmetsp:Transcript_4635/g.16229  ORF Transcript_4635/g.16229 Transcript_4635/m.16229 type:complete len:391 (+) Transcript_4635:678-1850(+)
MRTDLFIGRRSGAITVEGRDPPLLGLDVLAHDLKNGRHGGAPCGPRGQRIGTIVLELDRPPPLCFLNARGHGLRDLVRVEYSSAFPVPCRAANRLDQRRLAPQKSHDVRVQNQHQAHLGEVQALPQQVDTDNGADLANLQILQDLGPLGGVQIRVDVRAADAALLLQVCRHLLRVSLAHGEDDGLLVPLLLRRQLAQHVLQDAVLLGVHRNHGVQTKGGTDDHFRDLNRPPSFPGRVRAPHLLAGVRRCRQEDGLGDAPPKLFAGQRPILHRGWQPETVLHQLLLPGPVPKIHRRDLRDGDVGLVQNDQKVLIEPVQKGVRLRARSPSAEVKRVVLDSTAVTRLAKQLQIAPHDLLQSVRRSLIPATPQRRLLLQKLPLDRLGGLLHPLP